MADARIDPAVPGWPLGSPDVVDPSHGGESGAARRGPWVPGVATGVGSMPGTDPVDAAATVAGELPDLPHLVELPARGAGADMIGRTAALLVDLPAEVVPSGWRLTRRPGRDLQRARDFLAWDLDAAEQRFTGAAWVKAQLAGPWTLAAMLETPSGNRAVLDPGAVADLAASLTEGLLDHLAQLRRRLPGTGIVVQVDEPSLPAVLAGSLPTASGFGSVPAVDQADARQRLADLVNALDGYPVTVHCCHPAAPVRLLRDAGFAALGLDVTALGTSAGRLDPIGEAVEAGAVLLAGLVPTRDPGPDGAPDPGSRPGPDAEPGEGDGTPGAADGAYSYRRAAEPLLDLWDRLGLQRSRLVQVVPTPTCGLAGATPDWARRALHLCRDVARLLADESA
jgi:hypothetical protein